MGDRSSGGPVRGRATTGLPAIDAPRVRTRDGRGQLAQRAPPLQFSLWRTDARLAGERTKRDAAERSVLPGLPRAALAFGSPRRRRADPRAVRLRARPRPRTRRASLACDRAAR